MLATSPPKKSHFPPITRTSFKKSRSMITIPSEFKNELWGFSNTGKLVVKTRKRTPTLEKTARKELPKCPHCKRFVSENELMLMPFTDKFAYRKEYERGCQDCFTFTFNCKLSNLTSVEIHEEYI